MSVLESQSCVLLSTPAKALMKVLDQEFNSLDAQHEACSAYIASQRHEGWKTDQATI